MKVFISWSGTKSNRIARIFKDWLPSVIQTIEPYVSSEDIDKGARWSSDISRELADSSFGILCITKDNIEAPWISFEAGALSKSMDKARVIPFLFDIKRSEIKEGPLLQFQSAIFEKEEIKKLIFSLNKASESLSETQLDRAFEVWYPSLEKDLSSIANEESIDGEVQQGNDNIEILEEILDLARNNQKILRNPDMTAAEKIDEMKNTLDNISEYMKRSFTDKSYRHMDEDIFFFASDKFGKEVALKMAVSVLAKDYPWITEKVQELLAAKKPEEKRLHKDQLEELLDFTEHIFMRERGPRERNYIDLIRNLVFRL